MGVLAPRLRTLAGSEGKYDKEIKDMQYNIFFYGSSSEMHILAKVITRRLKMLEEIT